MSGTVLVTGGAGYVGSHCCKAFAQAGWRVVVFDNLSRGWKDFVRWGPLVEGDVRDSTALRRAMQRYQPNAVAHFAALAYVGESVESPSEYYSNNVVGSLTLLDAMREHGIDQLVFSSTCATYGIPEYVPIDESHGQRPINPYGMTKLAVERAIFDYAGAYGLKAVILRYFNAGGADPEGEIGERHVPETHVIPLALESAANHGSFQVFGDDYGTRDGSAIRDFVHVADLADAHLRALVRLPSRPGVEVFNLGTGTGTSVLEVAAAVGRVAGVEMDIARNPRRPGDPAELVADPARAREVLGWSPANSNIDTIIGDAWKWHVNMTAQSR